MLCAPLFAAVGEHAWIMTPMRLAMLPLFALDLWLVYRIGRALYTERWGVWMALVAGCIPKFFLVTTEFRTDDLWTTVWLLAVLLAVTAPLAGRRAFLFGLAMGACFSVSMKTTLLLLSVSVAGVCLLGLNALSRRKANLPERLKSCALIAAGMVILPSLLVAFFAAHGPDALAAMKYCIIEHNNVPGLGKWAKAGLHLWLFPMSLPVIFGLGWLCMHSSAKERIGAGRAFILMTCGAYYFLLRSYWPLVTAQDYIPVFPLMALAVLPFVLHLLSLTGWPARIAVPAVALLMIGGEFGFMLWKCQSPLDNELAPFEQNLATVLHLTTPNDYVMDGKGETIFRKRPVRWVLEGITITRIQQGSIPNDVRQRMIDTGTCVAVNHRLRPEDQEWLRANYLEGDGKVWVAGQTLGPAQPVMKFHIDIAANYSILSDAGPLTGTLDGAPLQDSQWIARGDHTLALAAAGGGQGMKGAVALAWTQAIQRGFSPFTKEIGGVTVY
jgi:hypothetical protein